LRAGLCSIGKQFFSLAAALWQLTVANLLAVFLPLHPVPAAQASELSGDPFKAPADIKQEQHKGQEQDDPSTAAAAGHKRFSDDTPAGPDVPASPATGWAEVYGSDLADEAAAEAAATAAAADDGSGSPAPAAGAAGGAAAGVDGLVTQQNGDVPFFFMDAHEAPERPGVCWQKLLLCVLAATKVQLQPACVLCTLL
jgi:hypothetical protein